MTMTSTFRMAPWATTRAILSYQIYQTLNRTTMPQLALSKKASTPGQQMRTLSLQDPAHLIII